MITLLPNKLYLRFHQNREETVREIQRHKDVFFKTSGHDQYRPYGSDLGPIDLGTVVAICRELRALLANPCLRGRPVLYYCYRDGAMQTNAAFALASYLILVEGQTPDEAWAPFALVSPPPWVMFRDVTNLSDFGLSILDCLRGLARGWEQGFFSLDGMDVDQFHTRGALGLSSICPKFVAFKGPATGPNKPSWAREPAEYMEALDAAGVTDVVRLNEAASYDARAFTARGIAHHNLEFPDCTSPQLPIVAAFMRICSAAEGTVAVHCRAGLGRTGTLIALWLMAEHQWRARETIAWLRIARPGSVIGAQQLCLLAVEGELASLARLTETSHESHDVAALSALLLHAPSDPSGNAHTDASSHGCHAHMDAGAGGITPAERHGLHLRTPIEDREAAVAARRAEEVTEALVRRSCPAARTKELDCRTNDVPLPQQHQVCEKSRDPSSTAAMAISCEGGSSTNFFGEHPSKPN